MVFGDLGGYTGPEFRVPATLAADAEDRQGYWVPVSRDKLPDTSPVIAFQRYGVLVSCESAPVQDNMQYNGREQSCRRARPGSMR